MNNINIRVDPHGGSLVNLLVLLATGAFSPLEGFMTRSDYEAVLDRLKLQNDILWPIPICLDVKDLQSRNLEAGQSVALRDPEGYLLAVLHIEDIWPIDHEKEASRVYGTQDSSHPGTNYLLNIAGDVNIGGKLEVISLPLHFDFKQLRMTPSEIRAQFVKLGWKRMVAFMTRNPIHRPQFEMTINAMRQATNPVISIITPG
jgi:sulfate adenylyltransferase